jgi:hypothetical protein
LGFGATEYWTFPAPLPDAPEEIAIQLAALEAFQEQLDEGATLTLPAPPEQA